MILFPRVKGPSMLLINRLLSIMKLAVFLTFITVLQVTAATRAQTVTLNARDVPLTKVMESIQEQTGYLFFLKGQKLAAMRVSANIKEVPLRKAMDVLTYDLGLEWVIREQTIVLRPARQAAGKQGPDIPDLFQQERTVSGKVTDEAGMPLIGVTVVIKGSIKATNTDEEGRYRIAVQDDKAILLFSMVGFEPRELEAGNQDTINVSMKTAISGLNEVVVVGYGTQNRVNVTGAISSVKAEQLNKMPTTSIGEMLRGAAPGLQVTMGSAAPGGTSSVLIRGRRSLSAGNDPLYIVDGVPSASIDDINANDVASVEILKDASAQSIYGARAANGVILITTKRGISGKTKVNVNTYAGVQNLYKNFEFYDGDQWAAYRKEAFYNAYGYYNEDEALRGLMKDVYHSKKYINWEDVMLSPAWQNKNDVLIQSGNDKTKYALSLGHFFQDGIVPSSNFRRFTGRLNVDQKLSEKVSLGANIAYTRSDRTIADGTFNSFITMPPLSEVYNSDGSLREDVTEAGESHFNPLWNNQHSKNLTITDRLNLNFIADWKIVKGLSFRLNSSVNTRTVQENAYLGINHTVGRNNAGRAMVAQSIYTDYLVENILNYTKDIGKHHLDGTAMASLNGIQWKRTGNTGFGFANDDLAYHAIASALSHAVPVYEFSDRKLLSYLVRGRYNFDSRYMLTLAMRVDGSSVFGANNKYGYFPSAAVAWRINSEDFMAGSEWISDLKLRLSYGQVGNQGISPYTTLGLADKYLTEFGDQTAVGYLPNSELTNPNLKWETSTSANLGIDYGFFKNRIYGSVEFYDTKTTDLLVEKSLSTTSGYASQLVNLGRVRNKGIEFSLNAVPVSNKDFTWNVGFNFSTNRNRIERINGAIDAQGNPVNDLNNRWFIGQSMNVYYDYQFDGIWQLDDDIAGSAMPAATPGSIRVSDLNGDNVISVDDRRIIRRDPKLISSFMTSFEYRNFSLSLDINGLHGGYLYNAYLATFETGGDLTGKRNGIRRDYWTVHNPSNEAPAPNFVQQPAFLTSLAYEKADHIRLRNVSLSYNVPEKVINRLKLSNLKLFFTASNIWTLTDVQGYGPEQSPGDYPEPRTLLFGLNCSF